MMNINGTVLNRSLFKDIEGLNMSANPERPKNDSNFSVNLSAHGNRMHEYLFESEDRLEFKYRGLIRKLSNKDNTGEQRMRIKEHLTCIRRLKKRVKDLICRANATDLINKLQFDKLMSDIDICIKN